MLQQPTFQLLHELRLPAMAAALEEQQGLPDISELSFEDRLVLLLEREKIDRADRRFQRLRGQARLRLDAVLEDLDFRKARGLDRSVVLRLMSCEWIRQGQSILITGATGSGKSYLACALGHQACRHGLAVRYFRLSLLLSELTIARADGSYAKLLKRLARAPLLILDDWGLAGLDDLAHAVKAANEGRVVVDSAVMEALLHAGSRENTAYQRLSVREIEVLDLMAEGFRNKAIAASLNITDKTVERHIQSIYAKIGDPPDSIQPRAHAIAVYRQSGAPQAAARTR